MDENNVFNSFSFKKWVDYVKNQKIEDEILRQRMEQVTRLRAKLVRERLLREQADILSDEDIDKLIGYISAGFKLQGPGQLVVGGPGSSSLAYGNLSGGTAGYRGHTQLAERVQVVPKDDNYIFDEIKAFYDTNRSLKGLHNAIPNEFKHNHKYNHRLAKSLKAENPRARIGEFIYNRRFK